MRTVNQGKEGKQNLGGTMKTVNSRKIGILARYLLTGIGAISLLAPTAWATLVDFAEQQGNSTTYGYSGLGSGGNGTYINSSGSIVNYGSAATPDTTALFAPGASNGAGSGSLGSILRIQNNGVEMGYNSGASLFDEKGGVQFNPSTLNITFANGVKYVTFTLDINQKSSNPMISVDTLDFYGSNTNQATLPHATSYSNGQPVFPSGTDLHLAYSFGPQGNNSVLLDLGRAGSGSGSIDMTFLVPVKLFGGTDSTLTGWDAPYTLIYLSSQMGGDGYTQQSDGSLTQGGSIAFGGNSGYEEFAGVLAGAPVVPELSTFLPLALVLVPVFGAHLRRRRQVA